jgi:hypothetical protein
MHLILHICKCINDEYTDDKSHKTRSVGVVIRKQKMYMQAQKFAVAKQRESNRGVGHSRGQHIHSYTPVPAAPSP